MIRWNMTGPLDITSDPSDLPAVTSGKDEVSGSLTRCTNLTLDRLGIATTRAGSSKVDASAHADTPVHRVIPMGGSAYSFAGNSIYEDVTTELKGNLTDAPWHGVVYNAYNDSNEQIFATNGTDKKRVVSGDVQEWGIDAPTSVATGVTGLDYVYTHGWEWTFLQEATEGSGGTYDGDEMAVWHFNNELADDTGNGHTLTNAGAVTFSSSIYRFGTHAAYFGSIGAASMELTASDHADFDLSDGTWTIDFWAHPVAPTGGSGLYATWIYTQDNAAGDYFAIKGTQRKSDGACQFGLYINEAGSGLVLQMNSAYVTGNVWHHIAVVEDGNSYYLFIDGVLAASATSAVRPKDYDQDITIGKESPSITFFGYLDEIRVSDVARWTSGFTPYSAEYPISSNPRADYAHKWTENYNDTHEYLYDWEEGILDGSLYPDNDVETSRATYWFEKEDDFGYSDVGVVYTYLRKSGTTIICESNPSDPTIVDQINNGIWVGVTQPTDPQVTHMRIYRTQEGERDLYYYAGEIAVGVASITLKPGDEGLGDEVEEDHDRLPDDVVAVLGPDYNGYLFALTGNSVYFSKPKQPEYWPSTYFVEVASPDDELVGGCLYEGKVYVFTRDKAYEISGTGYQSFFPLPIAQSVGALDQDGIMPVKGMGIFHTHNDGVWLLSTVNDQKWSKERFDSIFNPLITTSSNIPEIDPDEVDNCLMVYWKGKVYFGYPESGSTYADHFLIITPTTGQVEHYDYGVGFTALVGDSENDRLLAADTSGYLWELEDTGVTTDGGTAISWQIQSKDYSDQLRRYFPRAAKWDVDLGTAGTGNGLILLDGATAQTHAFVVTTTDRIVKKRLITGQNGRRVALRVSGTGPVDIYHAEVE
jgi:hypothetical protein